MSLLLLEDYTYLISRTNFATPFINAIATTLATALSLSSPPVSSIGCLQIIGSSNRIGNSVDVIDGQSQVNFVLLNTGAFVVANAVTSLQSTSGSQLLNVTLSGLALPLLVPGTVPTVIPPASSSSSSGLDSGAIAGIVIGGTVALFFIICAVIYVCCYSSSSKSKHTSAHEVEEHQSRADKHSSLDEQAEADQASEVEMHTMPEEEETGV